MAVFCIVAAATGVKSWLGGWVVGGRKREREREREELHSFASFFFLQYVCIYIYLYVSACVFFLPFFRDRLSICS